MLYTASLTSSSLKDGNTIIIDPSTTTGANGIGIYTDDAYSWTGPSGILPGQSIDINVFISPSSSTNVINPFIQYIGAGSTGGGFSPIVSLNQLGAFATSVELTLTRGATGTIVFYKAYGVLVGKGGSFIIYYV